MGTANSEVDEILQNIVASAAKGDMRNVESLCSQISDLCKPCVGREVALTYNDKYKRSMYSPLFVLDSVLLADNMKDISLLKASIIQHLV